MKLALLLATLLGGCTGADLCNDPDLGALTTCFTLHVNGSINADSKLDALQIDVGYESPGAGSSNSFTHRMTVQDLPTGLPVDVPIVFANRGDSISNFSSHLTVVALLGTTPVGIGTLNEFDLENLDNKHSQLTIHLGPASESLCFDRQLESSTNSETDVDCGGSKCPACTAGKRCNSTTDCVSLTCDFPSGSSTEVCGG